MLCQFERLVYPASARAVNAGSYMVAVYRPCEKVLDSAGNAIRQVKAVGYCLPISQHLRYDMQGKWTRDAKHGVQFEMDTYSEVIFPTREAITAYLCSGQIKGVGPRLAERIYAAFGNDTLEVLDKEPEKLLEITGISTGKLKKICESYLANRGARDVVAFLSPHGITANRAVKLYREYGKRTLQIVREHPYQLCDMDGIGFLTADRIAESMGFDKLSTERVDEGLIFTLKEAEGRGHLCMEKKAFIRACLKLLDTPALTEDMAANRAMRLLHEGRIVTYNGFVYRDKTAQAEQHLADRIAEHQKSYHPVIEDDTAEKLEQKLTEEEASLHVRLAPEQKDAVRMALSNGLSIITGGPGTGKTMIQKAILNIYRETHPDGKIVCCAPTGRAARRMEQSTGYPAATVHKQLGLLAGDDGFYTEPKDLDADLVLVDEVSMLDIYLAGHLFDAVKPGSQVVLIGDADQLPSVGPGAVLKEMIASECVPVVRLDKVFRQNAGSRIALNAKLIRHGNMSLEYGDDFVFVDSPDIPESAKIIEELYLRETDRYGVDNVALLTPYRQKTETGVNALNARLRDLINPSWPGSAEAEYGKRLFREGDKVMQIRNHGDVSNGDVGYITRIARTGEETTVYTDFGDGRVAEYDVGELDLLNLGYASTIHKSQGSEYKSVIINLQTAHYIMLTRPLLYTAITRGKEKVIIVGERKALCMAISRVDTDKRGTCLADRLKTLHQ